MSQIAYHNGKILKDGLPDWFTHLGVGVFDTLAVHKVSNQLWILGYDAHLDRFFDGITHIESDACSRDEIHRSIEKILKEFDWTKNDFARLRLIALEHDWLMTLEPWALSHSHQNGIAAVTLEIERTVPEIKSCSAIASYLARKKAVKNNVGETFLVDRNQILREGSWSNFFWVDQSGTIITPKDYVLPGVTRSIIIDLAKKRHKLELRDATLSEILSNASEAFMTQTSHGALAVTSIDGTQIGTGQPGPINQALYKDYTDFVKRGEEPFTKKFLL